MKLRASNPFLPQISALAAHVCVVCITTLLATHSAFATTFFWDSDGAGSAGTGGTGTWNASSSLWRSGTNTGTLS